MVTFIGAPRGAYGVEPICEVLPIAPTTRTRHGRRMWAGCRRVRLAMSGLKAQILRRV